MAFRRAEYWDCYERILRRAKQRAFLLEGGADGSREFGERGPISQPEA